LVLIRMQPNIIINFENPFLLDDYLKSAFKKGGEYTMLSIEPLFYLMTEKNMSFEDFYDVLYGLLNEELFRNHKYSTKFYDFLYKILSSSYYSFFNLDTFQIIWLLLLLKN
jgi:hypothetical protein